MVKQNTFSSNTEDVQYYVRERAEFNKSCNMIGPGSARNFPTRPAFGRWNRHLASGGIQDLGHSFFPIRTSRLVKKLYLLSVWKNIDQGREYRPNAVRSVPATEGSRIQTDLARLIGSTDSHIMNRNKPIFSNSFSATFLRTAVTTRSA